MVSKQKMCVGVEGETLPHLAYIWKNIAGKKYCKECTYKIQPQKQITTVSEKQKEKNINKSAFTESQFKFFIEIWNERKSKDGYNYCEVSGKRLPLEPLSLYFDHLLEKSVHPEYRFDKRNIAIVDGDVHSLKTAGFPLPKHKELIEKFKELIQMTELRMLKRELALLKSAKARMATLIDCSDVYGDGYFTEQDEIEMQQSIDEITEKINALKGE